jgi:heavy metal efflux system protein
VQRSLATVVAGGLLMATLLTLFLIPTYYFVMERLLHRREASDEAETEGMLPER